ncbi:DUF3419 family protein [Verminephrobacter eiseniae]|uniref:DUF3419 family protein n=1 Tax=Verminephrobacter eiseniae TaxID=364317 RepID=UPI0022387366|nr:DUF3419 family protein [Verminephrobacter eiseniae]MCW5238054.1 DUF3419 family protein [Verminephrobacter eiseniae]
MPQYFRSLNYTMGDEDANPEMQLLREESRHVMVVADCGSRVIPLLARRPQRLTCVDISPPQLAVCELRVALLKDCTREEFMGFLGYDGSMNTSTRQTLFQRLSLSTRSRNLLTSMFDEIGWGSMLYLGVTSRMIA